MDDLISRQQAIDADAFDERVRAAVGMTEEELSEDFKDGVLSVLNMMSKQPAITAEPHWIPVTERLPEENYLDDGYVEPSQYVLVYMSYHVCKVSRYWGHRKTKGTSDYIIPDWMDLEEHDGDNVLAWMPLPEPYKGVTE